MTLPAKKLYIKTYGCQMNVYDSEKMVDLLAPLGYALTSDPEGADLAILNTCHIREKAEQKMYSDLGRLKEHQHNSASENPMMIAVGGCVAQAEGGEILKQAPFVDLVFGPQTYHRLPELIAKAKRAQDEKRGHRGKGKGIVNTDFPLESKFDSLPQTAQNRASAFLTVQEGCDKFCTYCVVPYTRGAEDSRPAKDILREARHLIGQGAREITLLGQNVNGYHGEAPEGKGEWTLARLIRALAELEGVERLRYLTSHPSDMNRDLIEAHGEVPQLMPYLHLPIQSGSDRILKAMNRHHTRSGYLKIMDQLREVRPDMALASDFIVGFPGETDEDFEDTLDVVNQVGYAQGYSFKYSIRPGTPAAVLENQVSESVKAQRLEVLQSALNSHQIRFNQSTVGKSFPVLLERPGKKTGQLIGKSPYMQSVTVEAADRLLGQVVSVDFLQAHPNSVEGQLSGLILS